MPFDIYDFTSFTEWIDTSLHNAMSPFWTTVTEMLIIGVSNSAVLCSCWAVPGICRKKSMCIYAEQAWTKQSWSFWTIPDNC